MEGTGVELSIRPKVRTGTARGSNGNPGDIGALVDLRSLMAVHLDPVSTMIIKNQKDVTTAVLAELERAPNRRFREILGAAVRHLHEFVREARLTEEEFQQVCAYIALVGQRTNASHNEVVLACGTLGVSPLVCLLNNGNKGQTETTANMLGPFWRLESPRTPDGGSIVRSPTPGPALFVNA